MTTPTQAPKINSYFLVEKDTMRVRLGPMVTRDEARQVKRTYQDGNLLSIAKTAFAGFVR